jgi:hypothetical protein
MKSKRAATGRTTRKSPKAKKLEAALHAIETGGPFGPAFFLKQLAAFLRDRCPSTDDKLPGLYLHLADGEVLDVCHIIGIAPAWVALAVRQEDRQATEPAMRTELIPYSMVVRVTIRAGHHGEAPIGFDLGREPSMVTAVSQNTELSPEQALMAVAGVPAQAPAGPPRKGKPPR